MSSRRRDSSARHVSTALAAVVLALAGGAGTTLAAERCSIALFDLVLEEHGGRTGDPEVTVAADRAGLQRGDVLRQANGIRVRRCADLERAAAEAVAARLALLLAVERGERLVGIALLPLTTTAGGGGRAHGDAPASLESRPAPAAGAARPAHPGSTDEPPAAHDGAATLPRARPEVMLPAATNASTTLRRSAATAAAAFARLDQVARPAVPLGLYVRRLSDAERTVGELPFATAELDRAVQAALQQILDYHRTAREVWRTKLELLRRDQIDARGPAATTMPYFSDSRVLAWVEAYPFLQASLVEAPRETRFLLPGEVAGRWDPDRALELLWQHARDATERLAAWARGG